MTSQDYDAYAYDPELLNYGTPTIANTLSRTRLGSCYSTPGDSSQLRNDDDPLPFLPSSDDTASVRSDRQDPSHIRYTIEWKLCLMKKRLSTLTQVTDKDIILPPGAYWDQNLKARLSEERQLKLPGAGFKFDEAKIAVSVTKRAERDFHQCYREENIDWAVVEDQLKSWSHLLRRGERLLVAITFVYKEVGGSSTMLTRAAAARGTRAQHEERKRLAGTWQEVYKILRCPGPPCALGPHCWIDPDDGNKHYKVWTPEITCLIDHVSAGNRFDSHRDMPEFLRENIKSRVKQKEHSEGQARGSCNRKRKTTCSTDCPTKESCICASRSKIPGIKEDAVEDYYQWHCRQVRSEKWKAGLLKAKQIILDDCVDLAQLRANPQAEADLLVEKGVTRGVAFQFTNDVQTWLNEQ